MCCRLADSTSKVHRAQFNLVSLCCRHPWYSNILNNPGPGIDKPKPGPVPAPGYRETGSRLTSLVIMNN